jgi:multimeric flavodoxin WrbA
MKAVLLDGSSAADQTGERVRTILSAELQARGWEVESVILRDKKIADCAGDFLCWIRTPGVCKSNDDNRAIDAAIISSDLLVYLTPVTFGGYSSVLKRMVDHQIPNISPFFVRIEGETHHAKRYETYPKLLAVGWMEAGDGPKGIVFRHLVQRNALNMHCEDYVSALVEGDPSDEELTQSAQQWLDELQHCRSSSRAALPVIAAGPGATSEPIQQVLLLVGSPRRAKSTSQALGGYMLERLGERAVQGRTIYTHSALASVQDTQQMLEAVDGADLVTLAFPLYVDSLPAKVIETLERIAAHRQRGGGLRTKPFAAIVNCGFPEALHNETALAICATFATEAGFSWAGGLSIGGGEGLVHGEPLGEGGGRTARLRKALEMTAEALAQGRPIPTAAQELIKKPFVPPWLYRTMGGHGWKKQAEEYGAKDMLRQRPYSQA